MIILVGAVSGGYEIESGWSPKSKKPVPHISQNRGSAGEDQLNEAYEDDNLSSYFRYEQTLAAHSAEAAAKAAEIVEAIAIADLRAFADAIISSAHHHDLGKAHPVFQQTLHGGNESFDTVLAKSKRGGRHSRRKFRHELASALALLEAGRSDLEVYLAASHHGKVRLSIRALPDENRPSDENGDLQPERKFARGVWEGDVLPAADLGNGLRFPETALSLEPMMLGCSEDGEPSWLDRMLRLRDRIGVFRLAYLEAIVRAADVQASMNPRDYSANGESEDVK
jgi:CRISPR-associated endonuclease/helicase Cas3